MTKKTNLSNDRISMVFSDTENLTKIIQREIYSALLRHKQAGNSVCEWKDSKVVWIPAKNIPVKTRKNH